MGFGSDRQRPETAENGVLYEQVTDVNLFPY